MPASVAGRHDPNRALAHDRTLTLDGLRFHYRDWGDPAAPPLVLLHAYLMHARTWDTVAARLTDRFRVLALDLRGHGESGWSTDYHHQRLLADLEAFIEALELASCDIVGISIGGRVGISYAARHPERVRRLVALECFTSGEDTGDESYLKVMRVHLAHMRALPEAFESVAATAIAFRPLAPHAADDELRRWMEGGLRHDADGQWRWRYDPSFRQPGPPGRLVSNMHELRERVAEVQCPMLFPVGEESWMVEPTTQMATANPRAQVEIIQQAGHWVPLDNPTAFLEVVGRFLTSS
jgi:pimeloyl-ACP methyl ester carboxylesterase